MVFSFPEKNLPDGLKNFGNLDSLWAAGITGHTGSAHPIGTARQLLLKRHVSCIVGHKQGFDYAEMLQGNDKTIQAIICGSTYYHMEEYKNHNNHHFRGTLVISNVDNPSGFDFARFSLNLLGKWYGI